MSHLADRIATHGTPQAELDIPASLVRTLLREQAPALAELPLSLLGHGWDNVMFRLGDIAGTANLGSGAGRQLADLLRALHQPAPANAPTNPVRGVALTERAAALQPRLQRLASSNLITPELLAAWQAALAAPARCERRWLHGDLHPLNVLVHAGRISALLDWGDLTAGDVATDLSAIWMLLAAPAERAAARAAYADADDPVWVRARGWAFMLGAVHLDSGLKDNPVHAQIGSQALLRLHHDLLEDV